MFILARFASSSCSSWISAWHNTTTRMFQSFIVTCLDATTDSPFDANRGVLQWEPAVSYLEVHWVQASKETWGNSTTQSLNFSAVARKHLSPVIFEVVLTVFSLPLGPWSPFESVPDGTSRRVLPQIPGLIPQSSRHLSMSLPQKTTIWCKDVQAPQTHQHSLATDLKLNFMEGYGG